MSLDATNWAWRIRQCQKKGGSLKPLKKLVLLSLADRAGEDHCAYPSVARLVDDTEMDRKTVLKIIDELIEDGLIIDSGERRGRTKQVKVYQLIGVNGRETVPTTVLLSDENDDLNSTNNGTVNMNKEYQQRNSSNNGTVPTIPLKGTNNSVKESQRWDTESFKESFKESKNKKTWFCLKKLREEISLANDEIEFETIVNSKWLEREKRAFEIYNSEKQMSDELMMYHFTDWLLNAYAKYEKQASAKSNVGHNQNSSGQPKSTQLSEKQIYTFAQKLSHHPEFTSKYSEPGDSYEKLASKIAVKLSDPVQAKKWEVYLKEVGFNGVLENVA